MTDTKATRNCRNCNDPLETGARFCAGCGTTTDETNPTPSPDPTPPLPVNVRRVVGNDPKRDRPSSQLERPNDLKSWIAIVLAPLSIFTCGPLLSIPGAILAGIQLHAIKSGKILGSSTTLAHFGLWGNVAATVVGVAMMCLSVGFMGLMFA